MSPIAWIIIIFFVIGTLVLFVNKHRQQNSSKTRRAEELSRENDRLRHVVAEMSLDKYDQDYIAMGH